MRRLLTIVALALGLVVVVADSADAWRGRGRARRRGYSSNYVQTGYSSFSGDVQAIAQQKANLLASRGYGFHPGGYVGNFEGWGMGPTASAAMWSTCNGGNCMSARGRAQAWSERAGCYFAVNIW